MHTDRENFIGGISRLSAAGDWERCTPTEKILSVESQGCRRRVIGNVMLANLIE